MKTLKKNETPEQRLARWLADPARRTISPGDLIESGWEPGQDAYIEVDGMRYERCSLEGGGFAVVEWDESGNVIVM